MHEFDLEAMLFYAVSHTFRRTCLCHENINIYIKKHVSFGKDIFAITEHLSQCLGSATKPALGIYHQTPSLQIVPAGQPVVNWPYREGNPERGHLHNASNKVSLYYFFPRCPVLSAALPSWLGRFSPHCLANQSDFGWWDRLGPFWKVQQLTG